jgi:hypothetical protein
MEEYKPFHPFVREIDVSTRKKRRKAMVVAIEMLEKIRMGEEIFMSRVPRNLQSGPAYESADASVEIIIGAICELLDAYE